MAIHTMVFAGQETPLYDDFAPDKISSFTCSLIEKGEYYRAYVELLRLKSYYPSFLNTSVYNITSDYLFYKSKKFKDLLITDISEVGDESFIPLSLFRVDSLIKLKRTEDAEYELSKLYLRVESKNYSEYLNKRSVILSILNNKDNKLKDQYHEYNDLFIYSENIYHSRKNPILGALAGIIPGMGFVYADESGTGIVSMIVIGAGSAVTYASHQNGMDSLAVISGVITILFYGGSIAGGYMQSVKYNDRLMDTIQIKLNRELMPDRDLEEIYFKFGLNSNDCK